jgi:hypothetical protein
VSISVKAGIRVGIHFLTLLYKHYCKEKKKEEMFSKSLNILAATLACSSLYQPALSLPTVEKRDNTATPRNVLYVQTFTDSNNNFYNLTDLVTQSTGITHVILASLHLDSPTELNLNNNDITSSYWDPLWPMVSSLQSAGVKVMLMMGGAAAGSWANLASDVGNSMFSVSRFLFRQITEFTY